jgi:hypothetical protein
MDDNTLGEIGIAKNFEEFRQKIESTFGKLEDIADKMPDFYAHMVLSHGFMEYNLANDIMSQVKKEIAKNEGCEYDSSKHDDMFWSALRNRFYVWAGQNNLEKSLFDKGWTEYLND